MNAHWDGVACALGLRVPVVGALKSETESLVHQRQKSLIQRVGSQHEHFQRERQRPCLKTATRVGRLPRVGTGLDDRERQSGLALSWVLVEDVQLGTSLRFGRDKTSA